MNLIFYAKLNTLISIPEDLIKTPSHLNSFEGSMNL